MKIKVDNGYYRFYPIASHELYLLKAAGYDKPFMELEESVKDYCDYLKHKSYL